MTKILLIAFLFASCSASKPQGYNGVKLYAYQQPVISGAPAKGVIDESGKEVTTLAKPKRNIWVYLSFSPQVPVTPTELYINGVKYGIRLNEIETTPVTHIDRSIPNQPKTTILVPQTSDKVVTITPAETSNPTPATSVKKLIDQNDVVVGYTIKGKKYYSSLKKMTRLEPQATM